MKQLQVPFLANTQQGHTLAEIAASLRQAGKHPLAFAPWEDYPYKPEVSFSIAFDHSHLFLQYVVKESSLQAAHGKTNEPVYQDSCVEFFISFDEGATYYNFEFNSIGTVLAGFGRSKTERSWLPEDVLGNISSHTVIQKNGGKPLVTWELTLAVPLTVFIFHSLTTLHGKRCRANFYKCGDLLPVPHFLTWSNIESECPNFHLPQFFGTLVFEDQVKVDRG